MAHIDELRAAFVRIRELEARLAERGASTGAAWLLAAVAAILLVAGIGGGFGWVWFKKVRTRSAPVAAAAAADTIHATWYPRAPSFADIDGDGVSEIVGLAWENGHDAAPLHVVALDRKTYKMRWHAGPYPSQYASPLTHLVMVDARAVLIDSQGAIRVIDATNGREATKLTFPRGPVQEVCRVNDGSEKLLLNDGKNWYDTQVQLLDLTTGMIGPNASSAACGFGHEDAPCDSTASKPCVASSNSGVVTPKRGIAIAVSGDVLAHGDDRLTVTNNTVADECRATGVAWSTRTRAKSWEQPLMAPGDTPHKHSGCGVTAMGNGRVVHVYQTSGGPFRLVARAASSGAVLFANDLPDSGEGTLVSSVSLDGEEVFVVMNQSLRVFNAASGVATQTVSTL
jgi:hypothetical protein